MAAVTGQKRPRLITMRVTVEEAVEIGQLAWNDESVSAYIRRLIAEDKRKRKRK